MEWNGRVRQKVTYMTKKKKTGRLLKLTIIAAYKAELQSTIQAAFKLYYIEVL